MIGKKSVFKRMIQDSLKVQGLKDLVKLSKVYLHSVCWNIYEKLDPTSLNEVSSAKAATKVLLTDRMITVFAYSTFYLTTTQNDNG